jgi:AhpD family alkylhydroperoxidase
VTLLKLVDPDEMSPELRQYMLGYVDMVGDTAFSRMMANVPEIFVKFNDLYIATLGGNVEASLKELGRLRLSTLNGCNNCRYGNAFFAKKTGIAERKIAEIDNYAASDAFTEREKAALTLADRYIVTTPPKPLEPGMLANLRKHFSDSDILELCSFLAVTIGFQRTNALVDLEYSCALPTASEPATAAKS